MTGQTSGLPLELVAAVVVASMLVGAVDILRQPGWAWKQAGEPQVAYLILDLLLPLVGLAMYVFRARPKVVAEAAGPAPSPAAEPAETPVLPETRSVEPEERPQATGTDPFTGFREVAGNGYGPAEVEPSPEEPEPFAISSTFFSTGAATRSIRHPLALARVYRPRQRTSLTEDQPEAAPVAEAEGIQAEGIQVVEPEAQHIQVVEPEAQRVQVVEPEAQRVQVVEPETQRVQVVEPETQRVEVVEEEPAATTEPAPTAEPLAVVSDRAPTVPSGWKVDPTGRHQFRYWDGFNWTENVADEGAESRDSVSA